MGRKSQSKQVSKKKDGKEVNKFLQQKRKELAVLVGMLLKLTSKFQASANLSKGWEHNLEIEAILKEVRNLEAPVHTGKQSPRQSSIDKYLKWLDENGAQYEGVEISEFEGYDLGLKASKEFTEGSLILTVPSKIMMTEKNAQESELAAFITVDPLLQNMPNITLALFLLLEKNNADSFWKPYIDVLPDKYSTILYYTSDELAELRPSPVFESSLKLYRSIARQYAYFYNKIHTLDIPILKSLQDIFTYENYRIHFGECATALHELIPPSPFHLRGTRRRLGFHPYVVDLPAIRTKKFASSFIMRTAKEWNALPADLFPEQYNLCLGLFKARVNRHFSRWAVSTVMTRQNNIQLSDSDVTAFIPLWDMCNHEHGKITTDFNKQLSRGECYALRDFKPGEQIFIFYGARSNADLFLHNGFVYPKNQHDSLSLVLGVSSSDPLREIKLSLLNKLGLAGVTHYSLYRGHAPVSAELLAFIRIFNMNQEELAKWSSGGLPGDLVSSDEASSQAVGATIDRRAYTYLLTRCGLIRASYKKEGENGPETLHRRNVKRLKECEVQILDGAIKYLESVLQKLPTADPKS